MSDARTLSVLVFAALTLIGAVGLVAAVTAK